MIANGFSIQGKSHINRGVVCQDNSKFGKLQANWYIGVVADGVGSAPKSDIGSYLAVESLYDYCDSHISTNTTLNDLEGILMSGYEYALEKINDRSKKDKIVVSDYDTTLSAVIYDGTNLAFGHAGDGGIIVRKTDGKYYPITKRQKGVDGVSVRPLRAGASSWEFGVINEDIAGALLVTDGMLDGVFQPVLLNLPKDKMELLKGNFNKNNVYVTACELFMNPNILYKGKKVKNPKRIIKYFLEGEFEKKDVSRLYQIMSNGYGRMFDKKISSILSKNNYTYLLISLRGVSDDKTVVYLLNEKQKTCICDYKYYVEPEWIKLREKYDALLYNKDPGKGIEKKYEENVDSLIGANNDLETNNKEYKDIDQEHKSKTKKILKYTWGIIKKVLCVVILIGFVVLASIFLNKIIFI